MAVRFPRPIPRPKRHCSVSVRRGESRVDEFSLLDFTETLSQELILAKATGVRATAVLPFYLDGGIYTSLRK